MQIVPQILSWFGISNTRLLALQCSNAVKKLINPIIETEYSLFPKGTFSMSTKSPLRAENSTFFWQGHGQKSTAENAPKHAIPSEKFIFFCGWGIAPSPYPSSGGKMYPLLTPYFSPHQAFCINPASPRIPARFTPLQAWTLQEWTTREDSAVVDIAGVTRRDTISQGNHFTATRNYRDNSKAHERRMTFVMPPDARQPSLSS